mmetsp:Transcript_40985/g.39522  ORF Transcript_40985/g.39522 Transcript_40985/m.39522 type:complete len:82 (+) Transcript_40985:99-344(+)
MAQKNRKKSIFELKILRGQRQNKKLKEEKNQMIQNYIQNCNKAKAEEKVQDTIQDIFNTSKEMGEVEVVKSTVRELLGFTK